MKILDELPPTIQYGDRKLRLAINKTFIGQWVVIYESHYPTYENIAGSTGYILKEQAEKTLTYLKENNLYSGEPFKRCFSCRSLKNVRSNGFCTKCK